MINVIVKPQQESFGPPPPPPSPQATKKTTGPLKVLQLFSSL